MHTTLLIEEQADGSIVTKHASEGPLRRTGIGAVVGVLVGGPVGVFVGAGIGAFVGGIDDTVRWRVPWRPASAP